MAGEMRSDMPRYRLSCSLSGNDWRSLAQGVLSWPAFGQPPERIRLDGQAAAVTENWFQKYAATAKSELEASWTPNERRYEDTAVHLLSAPDLRPGDVPRLTVRCPAFFDSPQEMLELLVELPFELASFLYATVDSRKEAEHSKRIGMGGGHVSYGWGCAFKGEGHKRLVSRRWLEHGPWLLRRGANDTSLVQFHDFAADEATAREQWQAGHRRMGISDTGGVLQRASTYVTEYPTRGAYDARSATLKVICAFGREVSQLEMLDACAVRRSMKSDASQPIRNIAYVFVDQGDARKHLHELWLRELKCWTLTPKGEEIRLDDSYEPVPARPDWVRKLSAQ